MHHLAAAGAALLQVVFEGAPWNGSTVDIIRAARAHCEFVMLKTFLDSVQGLAAEGVWRLVPSPAGCGRCVVRMPSTPCSDAAKALTGRMQQLRSEHPSCPRGSQPPPPGDPPSPSLRAGKLQRPTLAALERLAALYGASLVEVGLGDLLEGGYATGGCGAGGPAGGRLRHGWVWGTPPPPFTPV